MKYRFLALSLWLILESCDQSPSPEVAYLNIKEMALSNSAAGGMPTSKFQTLWVEQNGKQLGAFTPPCTIPVYSGDQNTFRFIPGIALNGSSYLFNQYEMVAPIVVNKELQVGEDWQINKLEFNYKENIYLFVVEDFEDVGLNFIPTQNSDTMLLRTSDPLERLEIANMNNSKSGKVALQPVSKAEFKSIQAFDLPKFGANVWLELDYKTSTPLTLGIYSNEPLQSLQTPVVTLYANDEWNKVYLNLVSEVSGHPDAVNYNLFFGAINSTDSTVEFFIDNLKLLY